MTRRQDENVDDYLDRKAEEYVRHPWFSSTRLILGIFAIATIFSVLHWGFGVGTAKVVGQGEAYKAKVSSSNWTQQQGRFQQMFSNIRTADSNLTDDQIALDSFNKQHPNYTPSGPIDPLIDQLGTLKNAVAADKQTCHAGQNDYEALGRTYLAQDFRDHGLPTAFVANDQGWGTYQFTDYDCLPGTSTTQYPASAN